MERLTAAELMLMGLLAEQPHHGYELDAVIQERGIREWTPLGFSSIYYLLQKLERRDLVHAQRSGQHAKDRRTYSLTEDGRIACVTGIRDLLETVTPWHSPAVVAWANGSLLTKQELVTSLRIRSTALVDHLTQVHRTRHQHRPSDALVHGIFDHGIRMLQAELEWVQARLNELEGAHG